MNQSRLEQPRLVIPQFDSSRLHQDIADDLHRALLRVVVSGQYILGEEVAAFEHEFAAYLGIAHAVGVASGTQAVTLCLKALEIGAGDEVIAPAHTACATIAAIVDSGATPILCDIEPDCFAMNPEALPPLLSPHTKAIVAVHLYGQMAHFAQLLAFAQSHGIPVIEDCAQAHGASLAFPQMHSTRASAGTLGIAGAYGFYPTKNLGALGDAGCVVTNDGELASKIRELRQYGWRVRHLSSRHGVNSRLDELQAAVLRTKLPHLDAWNQERGRIAAIYDHALAGSRAKTPVTAPDCQHVYHQYVIQCSDRDSVRETLFKNGIASAIHYPFPIHQQPAFHEFARGRTFPIAERISKQILSLPIYPHLGEDAAAWIASILSACVAD